MNVLGKVSLILAIICVLFTFGLKLAFSGWMPYIGFGLGAGLFFFVFAIAINIKYITSFLKSESLHFVMKSLTVIILVVFLLFFANLIIAKQKLYFDMTSNKVNSLPSLTKSLINELSDEFNFYYFHTGNSHVKGFETRVREKMLPYIQESSKVHFQSFNIFKRPDLSKKFKIGNEESSLYAEHKGRISRVSDLTDTALTNTLLKLTKPSKKIYFIEGHGERKVGDETTFGLNGLKQQLERLHYKVEVIKDLSVIPQDAAMLVMVGPHLKVPENTKNHLESYMAQGGTLFVALDPGEEHQMEGFLSKFGIQFENNFVFSGQAQATQSELMVLTHKGLSSHEITETLTPGQNPALFIASTLKSVEAPESPFNVKPFIEHLTNAVGRKDIDPRSQITSKGQQYAGMISEGINEAFFRLVVMGDSDFLTNQFYTRPGNFDLALGIFSYLSRDEDLLKLKLPVPKTTYLVLTKTQLNLYLVFFVLPVGVLFFLFALFFKLRRYF